MTDVNVESKVADSAVDISGFMPAETIKYEVRKSGSVEGIGWFIELGGPSHPKALAWSEAATRRSLRRQAAQEAQQLNNRKVKPDERDPDDVRRENVEFVVSRIVTWSPLVLNGTRYEFSDKAAVELLSKPEMGWVLLQILEVLGDERSFTKGSATI